VIILDPWLQEKIALLADEFKHYRSIDSYLIKLSSLAYDLEDYCYGDVQKARNFMEKILKHPSLNNYMSHLSCYKDAIEAQVQRDPRVKKLREYSDILLSVLSEIPCREEKGIELSRDATFRIEKKEETVRSVKRKQHILSRDIAVKISIAIGVILALLGLIYALITIFKVI
jgi:hypothetical protein